MVVKRHWSRESLPLVQEQEARTRREEEGESEGHFASSYFFSLLRGGEGHGGLWPEQGGAGQRQLRHAVRRASA